MPQSYPFGIEIYITHRLLAFFNDSEKYMDPYNTGDSQENYKTQQVKIFVSVCPNNI